MAGNGSRGGAGRGAGKPGSKVKREGQTGFGTTRAETLQYISGVRRPDGTIGGAPNRSRTKGTDLTGKRVPVRQLATINGLYRAGYGVQDVKRNPDRARRMGFTTAIHPKERTPAGYRYRGLDSRR
jgi:hypothetical protein